MANGALEALRAEGLAGKVLVTGIDGSKLAIEAVRVGEMVATVSWDPYWQGSMGLSIGYGAKTGKFDPAKEPKEHREFYGKGVLVTKDNVRRSTTRLTWSRNQKSISMITGVEPPDN